MLDMDRSFRFALLLVGISLLTSRHPTEAWYKQAAGPSYYSVGRASGLLSGIRRSPYIRRSEPDAEEFGSRQNAVLKSLAVCVKDISPNLQSCQLVLDGTSTFQCKADVILSLDLRDCSP